MLETRMDLFPADIVAPLLTWATTYLLHSTLLLGGVWLLLRGPWHPTHATREFLWKLAAVGGLCTASGQLALDLPHPLGMTFTAQLPAPQVTTNVIASTITSPPVVKSIAISGEISFEPRDVAPTVLGTVATANPDSRPVPFTMPLPPAATPLPGLVGGLFAAVGLVMLGGLLRVGWQNWLLARHLDDCVEMEEGGVSEMLTRLTQAAGLQRPVRLLISPRFPEPAAWGFWRRTILLPERALVDLNERELHALLAHEVAHLARHDALWLWFGRLLCVGFAFQPLNRLARREWQKAGEFLCDAWAVRQTGDPISLARCLTEVAGWRWSEGSCPATLTAVGHRSDLGDRIEQLLQSDTDAPSSRRTAWMPLVTLLGLLLLAVIGPRTIVAAASPSFSISAPFSIQPANVVLEFQGTPAFAPLVMVATVEGTDEPPASRPAAWQELEHELAALQMEIDQLSEQVLAANGAGMLGQIQSVRNSRLTPETVERLREIEQLQTRIAEIRGRLHGLAPALEQVVSGPARFAEPIIVTEGPVPAGRISAGRIQATP